MTASRKVHTDPAQTLRVRIFDQLDYIPVWQAMRDFTGQRDATTADELWVLSHAPVFTQGQAGRAEHLLAPGEIPVVQIDRGGQITYHGPGQLVIYLLLDLRRLGYGPRYLVDLIEESILECLGSFEISAATRRKAPGVYVKDAKIAALGLRIRKGCSYHGLSLNVAMDLSPFSRINPCGFQGLAVTSVAEQRPGHDAGELFAAVRDALLQALIRRLGHPHVLLTQDPNQRCPNRPDAMS